VQAHDRPAAGVQVDVRRPGLDRLLEQRLEIHRSTLPSPAAVQPPPGPVMIRPQRRPAIGLWSDTTRPADPDDMAIAASRVRRKVGVMMPVKPPPVLAALLLALLVAWAAPSCAADPKADPPAADEVRTPDEAEAPPDDAASMVLVTNGEPGGAVEEVVKLTATVSAFDPATREITLSTRDGGSATFMAPPGALDSRRIRVGAEVSATLNTRLRVTVGQPRGPTPTHAAAAGWARGDAYPGALVGKTVEIVGTVKSVDVAARRATLQFDDGQTRTVPVRKDVDPSRYRVGDSVVIRVTQQLTLLTDPP
jgi:hypothetical protein